MLILLQVCTQKWSGGFFGRKGVPESRNIIFKLMSASEIKSLSQCSPVLPDYPRASSA